MWYSYIPLGETGWCLVCYVSGIMALFMTRMASELQRTTTTRVKAVSHATWLCHRFALATGSSRIMKVNM